MTNQNLRMANCKHFIAYW